MSEKAQTIMKIKKRKNYYVQMDKRGIEDPRLSWAATGLLAYLLGRPANWKIIIEHLKTVKTDGRDSTRSALNKLREVGYCHYFEVRERGKIVENIYIVFEVVTSVEEAMKEFELKENQKLIYKKVNSKESKENSCIQSQTGKAFMGKLQTENQQLLIKDDKDNKVNNNKITITNKKNSSRYKFLNMLKYSLLNQATIKNIENNIADLTEKRFIEIYNLTAEYIEQHKGSNFNAVLYRALNGEWNFDVFNKEKIRKVELDSDKRKWLQHFGGIICDKELKEEIERIIVDISLENLNKNKSKLSKMNLYEFKQHLYSLKKLSN